MAVSNTEGTLSSVQPDLNNVVALWKVGKRFDEDVGHEGCLFLLVELCDRDRQHCDVHTVRIDKD